MARSSKKEKELICSTHDRIKYLAASLYSVEFESTAVKDLREVFTEVRKTAREIEKLAQVARERGQAMENRLQEYRNAIEGLGFERVKE